MKLSKQGRFELRVWLAERAQIVSQLQYIYDEIKDWDIDDINLYKRLTLGEGSIRFVTKITKEEHEFIISKMNFVKNGDKTRLKD